MLDVSKTEWDLSMLFSGDDDPKIEKVKKQIEEEVKKFVLKWKGRDDYLEDPKALKEALDEYEKLMRDYGTEGNIYYYFAKRSSQDQNDPVIRAKEKKIEDFALKKDNELMFFRLNLTRIPLEKQPKFLEDISLRKYRHFLSRIFAEAKHILSEKEERIMNLKSSVSHFNWMRMISNFLVKEERIVLNEEGNEELKNFSEIMSLLSSQKKEIRDCAAKALNEILANHVDAAENELNSIMENKKINDELRNYPRADSARHIIDDIETEIVDSLIEEVTKRFDLSKKFYELKAKLMGLHKLEYHERNVPYGKVDKKYNWQEGADLVYKVLSGLDEEFGNIVKKFIEKGHIDVFPKKGKTGGGYCANNLVGSPVYILLNYTDRMRDIATLAHEAGHGINDELMKKQNSLNYATSLATAEVASTFMEDFVFEELLKDADEETRLSLMVNKLNDDISTIIRQVACYNLEMELHKEFRDKGYLSKEDIGKIFRKNMESYMGEYVEQSAGSENWWISWEHIRYLFYVYSYASGLLISKAMQRKVKEDPGFISKVKEFLSAGMSKSPKEIFLDMGIDISKKEFWAEGMKEVEDLLNETEALAKKLGKI